MLTAQNAVTIADLRYLAERRLPKFVFMPMETGSGNGDGVRRNVERLQRYHLMPRVMIDLAALSQKTTIFGRDYASPFGITPVGYAGNFRRGADRMLAEAAQDADIPFILAGGSNQSIETIASAVPSHSWCQIYAARDPSFTDRFVGRARDAGVEVLVYTIDVPVRPRNDYLARRGIRLPAYVRSDSIPYVIWQALSHPYWTTEFLTHGGPPRLESWAPFAPAGASTKALDQLFQSQIPSESTWDHVAHIRKLWPGKLVIKGILDPQDAAYAIESGADAVTVSNHGGNRLSCIDGAIDYLPGVKAVVGNRVPVFFDGGIRRGMDIVTALCLGADFCFVGRATLYGVIAGGSLGASRAITILRDEITQIMAMGGLPRIADLRPDRLMLPA